MSSLKHSFLIACLAGLVAEVSVQSSALEMTAYGWLPLAVAVCVFVIAFSFARAIQKSH